MTHRYWMQTASGLAFDFLDPQPDQICIEDIAHQLAATSRYRGATRVPYSVAEHSMRAAHIAAHECRMLGADARGWKFELAPRAALLHDAEEAYTSDLISPWKALLVELAPELRQIIKRIKAAIGDRFNSPIEPEAPEIKRIDLRLLATEKRDLMPPSPRVDWARHTGQPLALPYSFSVANPLPFDAARRAFLTAFRTYEGRP